MLAAIFVCRWERTFCCSKYNIALLACLLLRGVCGGAAGLLSILTWGAKGSKDVALPITVGPLGGGEKGPRGKI